MNTDFRGRRPHVAAVVFVAALAAACGGGGSSSSPTAPSNPGSSTPPTSTFSSINSQVFQARCTGCHTSAGRSPEAGLNLQSAVAYANLVNVPSTEKPGLMRVAQGNPDASYLVHKLEGRSDITGSRMPLGGPFLTAAEINAIRQWIQSGAQNN